MRGYFGIGVQNLSKAMNAASLFRTAHAFGASFLFTVGAVYSRRELRKVDTSKSWSHVPLYAFDDVGGLRLPMGCSLIGIEFTDDAVDLPSFPHPPQAAYILGPERGDLSPEISALCEDVVKIPTKFCVNVALAGALVMYDRTLSLGRYEPRPAQTGIADALAGAGGLPSPALGPPLADRIAARKARGRRSRNKTELAG
jgi:tRNA G18 (ribose-2'-O)-methylase SpoU